MRKLTDCEECIMLAVWNSDNLLTMGEIREVVNTKYNHKWAPQTVSTFITRLIRKKYLTRLPNGRTPTYIERVGLEEYRRDKLEYICKVLYNGSKTAMYYDASIIFNDDK